MQLEQLLLRPPAVASGVEPDEGRPVPVRDLLPGPPLAPLPTPSGWRATDLPDTGGDRVPMPLEPGLWCARSGTLTLGPAPEAGLVPLAPPWALLVVSSVV